MGSAPLKSSEAGPASTLEIVEEHNRLNGFRFVIVEFTVIGAVAMFVAYAGLIHGRAAMGLGGLGIGCNSLCMIGSVVRQRRRGDRDVGLYEVYFGKDRRRIQAEHPDLSRHTSKLTGALLVPFLLLALLAASRGSR